MNRLEGFLYLKIAFIPSCCVAQTSGWQKQFMRYYVLTDQFSITNFMRDKLFNFRNSLKLYKDTYEIIKLVV